MGEINGNGIGNGSDQQGIRTNQIRHFDIKEVKNTVANKDFRSFQFALNLL